MSDLNTKTLDELDVIETIDENDTLLVESGGRMKKFSGSFGGGGIIVLTEDANNSIGVSYNQILSYIDDGKLPVQFVPLSGSPNTNILYILSVYGFEDSDYYVNFYSPSHSDSCLYYASSTTENLCRVQEPA